MKRILRHNKNVIIIIARYIPAKTTRTIKITTTTRTMKIIKPPIRPTMPIAVTTTVVAAANAKSTRIIIRTFPI